MFPPGWPGLALLLLRVSVAGALLTEDYSHRYELSPWIQGIAILLSVALFLGYLTPIAAALGLLFHLVVGYVLNAGASSTEVIVCVDALALALVGPGAYSLDSYLFGRRVVLRPPP